MRNHLASSTVEPVCLPACLIPPTPQALGPWVLIYRKLEGLESAEPRWIAFRSVQKFSREKKAKKKNLCGYVYM
jgi:hypothetical protein